MSISGVNARSAFGRVMMVNRAFLEAGRKRIDDVIAAISQATDAEAREVSCEAARLKLDGLFAVLANLVNDLENRTNLPVVLELPLSAPAEIASVEVPRAAGGVVLDDLPESVITKLRSRALVVGLSLEAYCEVALTRSLADRGYASAPHAEVDRNFHPFSPEAFDELT